MSNAKPQPMPNTPSSDRRRLIYIAVFLVFLLTGASVFARFGAVEAVSGQEGEREGAGRVRERIEQALRRRRNLPRGEGSRPKGGVGQADPRLSLAETPAVANRLPENPPGDASRFEAARKRYDKPREALEFFLFKRLAEGDQDLSYDKYLAAREQMAEMEHYSTAAERPVARGEWARPSNLPNPLELRTQTSATWTPLGPGNIGGRTRAMLIDPQNPEIMYAAGVSGGVWKTTNGGTSWAPITDLIPNITVSSMVMEPGNPQVIYLGTGEGVAAFQRDTSGDFRGAGIFKTTDGGTNWIRLDSTANADFYFVNDLIVSPKDKNRIYAATRTGVWRTLDGGATWSKTLNPLNQSGQAALGGCLDLALRTDQSADILFAACGTFEQATVYRNTDAAGSAAWSSVLTEANMGRTALAIAPSDQNIVYAVASSIEPGQFDLALHAVFRSTAGGDAGSWTPQTRNTSANKLNRALLSIPTLALSTDCGYSDQDDFFGQAWFDLTIAVDPLDANRVWIGGIDIFRSDDGGSNWGLAGPSYVGPNFDDGPIHPDHHVILFHPQYNGAGNQKMYVGNDGGVYRTDNARAAVATTAAGVCQPNAIGVQWLSLNANYGVTQFYHGSVAPDGKTYYGGTQDNGTVLGTDAGGIDQWIEINGGDGGYTAFDFTDPQTLYAAFTNISFRKSTDRGGSFGPATNGINDGGFFITPYVMDPSDPQRLWTGGDYLWRTVNGAGWWERASSLTAGGSQVSALAIAPANSNRMLAGMGDGFILRNDQALSSNNLTNWASTRPRTGYVSSLTFDPANPDVAYATYSNFGGSHVWKTSNGGVSWVSIDGTGNGALPDIPVHSLAIDPSNPARLYLGTDLGVFVSNNGGAAWAVEFTGFANVITESLQLNIKDGVTSLYAFTHGRGVWRVQVNQSGCAYSLTPPTIALAANQKNGTIQVAATPNGCPWTAQSNASWLSVNGGGNAGGTATFTVEDNPGFESRTGTATVAGKTLSIIQPGKRDEESPVILVTESSSPSGSNNVSGAVTLAGTIQDNDKVAQVKWETDRGASGLATLLDNNQRWSVPNLPLGPGVNLITLTARDQAGNQGIATWSVNATPAAVLATAAGSGSPGFAGDGQPAIEALLSRPIRIAFDQAGILYLTDSDNNAVRKVTPDGSIFTIAGNGSPGFGGDGGPSTQALLNFPIGVAVDTSGNIYICDNANARIRKINAATGVITTIAGNGQNGFSGDGGPAIDASLNSPQTIDVDPAGNVYIADFGNHRIRKVTVADGKIATVAGTGVLGYTGDDGPATNAQLNSPNNVTVDAQGNLVICDAGNSRIRLVSAADGKIVTIVGNGTRGFGGDGGPAVAALISTPVGAVLDRQGNLYFSDRGNHRLRRVDAATKTISTIAGTGEIGFNGDGLAALASQLNFPTGLAFNPAGILHVADRENRRVRKLLPAVSDGVPPAIAITTPTGQPTWTTDQGSVTIGGTATDNTGVVTVRWMNDRGGMGAAVGAGSWKIENLPLQLGINKLSVTAWDIKGNAATARLDVNLQTPRIITTLAGDGRRGDRGDGGIATSATLFLPSALVIDGAGNAYLSDSGNHRVRKVSPNGTITALAGSGMMGAKGDGGPALAASFNSPQALAIDSKGNLYIADSGNNRIRRVTPAGIVTTVAGNGKDTFAGDGGPATEASLYQPFGVAVDAADNLLIADSGNLRLRKVSAATGIITTLAGDGRYGSGGDGGPATQAQFKFLYGVTVDRNGLIYVVDGEDHRVRRIDANGRIDPYAGSGQLGALGDGGPALNAQLNYPSFISTDPEGNLYIADYGNHRIRKVTFATGLISTVAGTGAGGQGVDGVDPLNSELLFPNDMAVDGLGRLFIADTGSHRIRKLMGTGSFQTAAAASAASYNDRLLARDSLAAAFGGSLATATAEASVLPLPTTLAGTTVSVRDAAGIARLAPLFYASPGQINFLIPASTAIGTATLTVTSGNGQVSTGLMPVGNLSPGFFAANADGKGVAAASLLRIKPNGQLSYEPVARFDAPSGKWVPIPIDLGPAEDQVFLALFGTGWRYNGPLTARSATIAGIPAEILYAGPQPDYIGLDQLNLRLDRQLAGKGLVDIQLTIDGLTTNLVQVRMQ